MFREQWLSTDAAELAYAALEKCVVRPLRQVRATRSGPGRRELWIHIGAHKTATTLVQSILKRRRHVLHRQSIHFESWGYPLGKALLREAPLHQTSLAELRRELEERLGSRPEPVAILSAESFCGNPYDGYRNIASVAGDLREITRSFRVQIVLATRRQDDFLESIYGQSVKEGGVASFEEFASGGLLDAFDWEVLASAYREQFGDDRVRTVSYDRLVEDPSRAVETLFEGCGRSFVCRTRGTGRVNPGLSRKGIEMARRCNAIIDVRERKQFRRFLEKHFSRRPGEDVQILDVATRRAVQRRYGLGEKEASCVAKVVGDDSKETSLGDSRRPDPVDVDDFTTPRERLRLRPATASVIASAVSRTR
ncbi:MAG: hypothetical protein WBC44_08180 [Planctomycetaceae bacterium]